jgi:hypothetical protein
MRRVQWFVLAAIFYLSGICCQFAPTSYEILTESPTPAPISPDEEVILKIQSAIENVMYNSVSLLLSTLGFACMVCGLLEKEK